MIRTTASLATRRSLFTTTRFTAAASQQPFIRPSLATTQRQLSTSRHTFNSVVPENATQPQQQQTQGSSQSTTTDNNNDQQEQQQQQTKTEQAKTLMDKVKQFVRKYGITGVVVYFGIYYLTWASFYIALQENWLGAGDVMEFAKKWGLEKYLDTDDHKNKKVANIGLAWILTKFTEPLRFAATILVTPYVLKVVQKLLLRR